MFCGKCGAQLPDGAVFCGNCGSPVGQTAGEGITQGFQPEVTPVYDSNVYGNAIPSNQPEFSMAKLIIKAIIEGVVLLIIAIVIWNTVVNKDKKEGSDISIAQNVVIENADSEMGQDGFYQDVLSGVMG